MPAWKRRASRALGGVTAAYGASLLVWPGSLAKQCALESPDEPAARLLALTFGVRDLCSGISILAAGGRGSLRTALLLRGAFDAADAAGCALLLRDRGARRRVSGVAGVWSAASLGLAASL